MIEDKESNRNYDPLFSWIYLATYAWSKNQVVFTGEETEARRKFDFILHAKEEIKAVFDKQGEPEAKHNNITCINRYISVGRNQGAVGWL